MKSLLFAAVLGVLWSAPARAGDSHESLTEEGIKAFTSLADGLATIKDKDTAAKAKPGLEATAKKIADLAKRSAKLGEPAEDKKEELTKKFKPKMEAVQKKVFAEFMRIAKLDNGMEILKGIETILNPSKEKPPEPVKK